jgi:hypothetical protein
LKAAALPGASSFRNSTDLYGSSSHLNQLHSSNNSNNNNNNTSSPLNSGNNGNTFSLGSSTSSTNPSRQPSVGHLGSTGHAGHSTATADQTKSNTKAKRSPGKDRDSRPELTGIFTNGSDDERISKSNGKSILRFPGDSEDKGTEKDGFLSSDKTNFVFYASGFLCLLAGYVTNGWVGAVWSAALLVCIYQILPA